MMNTTQRTKLAAILAQQEEAKCYLDELRDKLQTKYDDASERWQESERGEAAQAELDALESACDHLETIIDAFGSCIDELQNAHDAGDS